MKEVILNLIWKNKSIKIYKIELLLNSTLKAVNKKDGYFMQTTGTLILNIDTHTHT